MKSFRIFIILITTLFLFSCGSIKDGLSNQKKNSSDEFLVEKKSPLVMPPEYDQLPLPKSEQENPAVENNSIKSLITNNDSQNQTKEESNISFEENILKKIKSN